MNNNENFFSRLLRSMYAMDPVASRILMQNQRMAQKNNQQQADTLPYVIPSVPVGTVGLQLPPLGFTKPLPNVSPALRRQGVQPDAFSSSPSMPMMTFGSQPHSLGLAKDMEPLPNASSDLVALQPQQALFPETSIPTVQTEPTESVPFEQSRKDTASPQSFWDKLRNPELLQRLSDYALGYALSDGDTAKSLANAALYLRRGDEEREQKKQVNQTVEYLKSKGYSEEEAQFMAGNKDALNAFLVQTMNGDNASNPNSKEDLARLRETIDLKNSETISSNTLHDIERFMNYLEENGEWATGNSAHIQARLGIPQHRDMSSLLDSIKNRIGIDRLETMRQYSRNGASGFGNLTEKELEILKSYLGEIKYNLGHKELMFRLKKIREILGKMKSNVLSLLENHHLALTKENVEKVTALQPHSTAPQQEPNNLPVVTSKEDLKDFPAGARVVVQYGNERYEIIKDR